MTQSVLVGWEAKFAGKLLENFFLLRKRLKKRQWSYCVHMPLWELLQPSFEKREGSLQAKPTTEDGGVGRGWNLGLQVNQ